MPDIYREFKRLPRNVWAVTLTSFLTDISSEMVANLTPLFLAQVLGVKTGIIGLTLLPASVIAGLLWQAFSPAAPFLWGATLALTAAVLLGKVEGGK